jgi:integral membrane protein
MTQQRKSLNWFKITAFAEGVSFILLLFIAMPLKYLFAYPLAVTWVGWAHGVLFTAYLVLLLQVWIVENWTFGKVVLAFVAGLIPFGPFWFERKYLQ